LYAKSIFYLFLYSPLYLVDKLFLSNSSGEFEIFSFNPTGELVCTKTSEGNFHDKHIITIDFLPSKQLILTAAADNKVHFFVSYNLLKNFPQTFSHFFYFFSSPKTKVKIWSLSKVVLSQINVPEKLSGAFFCNNKGDILLSHHKKISLIWFENLSIPEKYLANAKTK